MIEAKKHLLSKEQFIKVYQNMLLIRRFEEKCGQLYGMGLIGGFCHLYIGQEAVITGISAAKRVSDSTITSYRDHAHMILAGTPAKDILAELTGKSTGCSKGKGGSMHMFDIPGKFYGGHGIVGAQVPVGTGLAFAEQYLKTDNVCFTFLGDGAINQGQVYEAFNMAALWNLPVIYVIENNEYSMGTSVKRSTKMTELYKKGESFGIPGFQVDGMNAENVYNATVQAAEYTRNNNGPIILEMKTYRFRGHSMSDPAKYRDKDEVDSFKENDSILNAKKSMLNLSYANEDDFKNYELLAKKIVQEAVEFAENSPLPDEEELFTNILY